MHRKFFIFSTAICLSAVFLSSSFGAEWLIKGARARAMGGAQVAIASGIQATYWNPAILALHRSEGFELEILGADVGVDAVITGGLEEDIKALMDVINSIGSLNDLQSRFESLSITQQDIQNVNKLIDIFSSFDENSEKAFQAQAYASALDIRLGRFALSSQVTVLGSMRPIVDRFSNNILNSNGTFGSSAQDLFGIPTANFGTPSTPAGQQLAAELDLLGGRLLSTEQANALVAAAEQAGVNVSDPLFQETLKSVVSNTANQTSTGTLNLNKTGVEVYGLTLVEVRGSAAMAIVPSRLAIGGNVRILQGLTFRRFVSLQEVNKLDALPQQIREDLAEQRKETVQFTLDLSAILDLGILRVGAIGKNLIPVFFKAKNSPGYELKPQFRLGAALFLLDKMLTLAVDIDVLPNDVENIPKLDAQMLAFGAEFAPINNAFLYVALRAGVYKNLIESEQDEVWSVGVGLGIGPLMLDVAFAADRGAIENGDFSLDYTKDPKDIPTRLGLSATLTLQFTF